MGEIFQVRGTEHGDIFIGVADLAQSFPQEQRRVFINSSFLYGLV